MSHGNYFVLCFGGWCRNASKKLPINPIFDIVGKLFGFYSRHENMCMNTFLDLYESTLHCSTSFVHQFTVNYC